LLTGDDVDVGVATDNVETLRAEFAAVVEERRRRAATAEMESMKDASLDAALAALNDPVRAASLRHVQFCCDAVDSEGAK
jgi:hypothetical protein